MKNILLTLSLVGVLLNVEIQAQNEYLAEIHVQSNYFSLLTPAVIENINWVYNGISAVDDVGGTFYFMRSSIPDSLCGYNLNTQTIETHVPCYDFAGLTSVRSIHFNPNSETLDGIHYSQTDMRYFIGSVDISTGNVNQLGAFLESSYSHYVNMDAIDISSNELILIKADFGEYFLRRYSLEDGNLLDEVTLSLPTNTGVTGIAYSQSDQVLYALLYNWSDQVYSMSTIGQQDGTVTQMSTNFTFPYFGTQTHSLDEENLIYYIQGGANDFGFHFAGISLVTGELVSGAQLLPSGDIFQMIENLINGRFINSLQKLVCMHWGDEVVDLREWPEGPSDAFFISVNGQGDITVKAGMDFGPTCIELLDISGKICYSANVGCLNSGNSLRLDSVLSPGVYFIRLDSGTGHSPVRKFVVN